MGGRPRKRTLSELLNAAREAVRREPAITLEVFADSLGGGTTHEILGALKAARWEAGMIPGLAEDVLAPAFASLVLRDAPAKAAEPLDLDTVRGRVPERIDECLRATAASFLALFEEGAKAMAAEIAAKEAASVAHATMINRTEQETLSVVETLRREVAEARADSAELETSLRATITSLESNVRDLCAARQAAEAALQQATLERDVARTEARIADELREDAKERAREAVDRSMAELESLRLEAGMHATRAATLEAEVRNLLLRLDDATTAREKAAEAKGAARARAAAAEARERALRGATTAGRSRVRR